MRTQPRKFWNWFIRSWIVISIFVLVSSLLLINGQKESEVAGTSTFIMFIMSFPSGWLGYALETNMLDYFAQKQMYIYADRVVLLLAWAIFFVVGCVQWAILAQIVRAFQKSKGR